jgi:hypothetical protein
VKGRLLVEFKRSSIGDVGEQALCNGGCGVL